MADADHKGALRACTRCSDAKPATLEFFPPHPPGKYGLHSRCIPCKKLEDAERRARPDQKQRQQAWRDANKAKIKAYNQAYREAGYASTEDVARWRAENLDAARRYEREKQRRIRSTPAGRLKARVSARLWAMLRGKKAGATADRILGFTSHELARHIERQFTKGMSWAALMRGEIEIDHIIPVASFSISGVDDADVKACWALSNLRPMWAQANRSKGDKVLTLL